MIEGSVLIGLLHLKGDWSLQGWRICLYFLYNDRHARPVVMDETGLRGTPWSLLSPHRPTSTSRTAPLHKESAGVDQGLRINLERSGAQHPLCSNLAPALYQVTNNSNIEHDFLSEPKSLKSRPRYK